MKPSIQLRLGQHLTMTPQLQQAIKLLQLSTLELQQQIQEALEENPMLEIAEDQEEIGEETGLDNVNGHDTEQAGAETAEIDFPDEPDVPTSSELQDDKDIPDELPVDTDWDAIYDMPGSGLLSSGPADDNRDFYENQSSGSESLQEHLLWQLNLTPLSDTDRAMANSLIDSLDEDGYLN